jgi:hypothetical protein
MTIEMGALFSPPEVTSPNAPPANGRLFTFTVDASCNVTIAENAIRAGVVMVGGGPVDPNFDGCSMTVSAGPPCTGDSTFDTQMGLVDSPDCWCKEVQPRQCHGDADGTSQGKGNYWVELLDLDVLIAAWNKPYGDIKGQTEAGTPLICADFDHLPEGKGDYRVALVDLGILIDNWNITNGPDPNCLNVTGVQ